jgi:HK97 family phage major capsid protein
MKTIKEMRERQSEIVNAARGYLDQITEKTDEGEARELESKYDAAMADFDKLESEIQRRAKLDDAEKRHAASGELVDGTQRPGAEDHLKGGPVGEPEGEDRGKKPSEEEVFTRAMQFGPMSLDAELRSVLKQSMDVPAEVRAQSVGTDAAGGYTVPEGFQAEIMKAMQAWGPMLNPGVTRVINTATGNQLPWPTVDDTSNTGTQRAENAETTEEDVTFGQRVLNAYTFDSSLVRVSLELLQDSAFDMNQLLAELFGERIGRSANAALTTGTGTNQPNGIATAASAGTSAAASALTFDNVIDLMHSVDPAYRQNPSCAFMFNDSTLGYIRKLKDGDGNYIWQEANVRSGEPSTILGRPYVVNQAMADIGTGNRSVLFGDMNKYVVRRVRDFTLMRLAERYAEFRQVGFIAFNRFDGELVDTAAVKRITHA